MTVTKTYRWRLTPRAEEAVEDLARRARKVLGWACDGDPRITCKGVTGEPFGFIDISFKITGRDLWWTGQLGQDIINLVTKRLLDPAAVDIDIEREPIHDHRGYAYGRTARVNRRGRSSSKRRSPSAETPQPQSEASEPAAGEPPPVSTPEPS